MNPLRTALAALLLTSLLACKKDEDEDPNRPRNIVLTWTVSGPTRVRLTLKEYSGAQQGPLKKVLVDRYVTSSGTWDTTAAPGKFFGDARVKYDMVVPGSRVRLVATQDGKTLLLQDVLAGSQVSNFGDPPKDMMSNAVTISPSASQ